MYVFAKFDAHVGGEEAVGSGIWCLETGVWNGKDRGEQLAFKQVRNILAAPF